MQAPAPRDFPEGAFKAVSEMAGKGDAAYRASHNGNPCPHWREFVAGALAVEARWRSVCEADEAYTELARHGTQAGDDRRREDLAIFAFFVNALSVAETAAFQLYSLAGIFDPAAFDLVLAQPKKVNLSTVCAAFQSHHSKERLTTQLESLRDEPELGIIRDVRNVLAHRGQPPRAFAPRPPQLILGDGTKYPPDPPGRNVSVSAGLTLDERMTEGFRACLSGHLCGIFVAAADFASARI